MPAPDLSNEIRSALIQAGCSSLEDHLLRGGQLDRERLIENAAEAICDALDKYPGIELTCEEQDELAEQAVDQAVAARLAEQAAWDDNESDFERYMQAAQLLKGRGVLLMADFTCCNTCGHAEIADAAQSLRDSGFVGDLWGYGFYHNQDTDRAVHGGGVMVGFSTFGDPNEHGRSEADAARLIVDALEECGLATSWSGQVTRKIEVEMPCYNRKLVVD